MTGSLRNKLNHSFLRRLFGRLWDRPSSDFGPRRGPQIHVIILDGTMSSLTPGCESNAGLAYKIVREVGPPLSIYYEPGMQWQEWTALGGVIAGKGINRQIRRAYGYLASRYHEGDQIYLLGYSRGAYAVRSLAGIIERIGLLRAEHATERNVLQAYRHYQSDVDSDARKVFTENYCLKDVPIEMVGVWDTVKSLGINAPVLWRFSVAQHAFHSHHLGANVKRGYHALGLHETRVVYKPVMWESGSTTAGHIEQVWFRGSHGDVGGHLGGREWARPLANIPLVWMLEQAEAQGLPLPENWQMGHPRDPHAPSIGTWAGWGKLFVMRRKRIVGADPSERLHSSVDAAPAHVPEMVKVGP